MNQPNQPAPKSADLLPDGISLSDLKVVRNYFGEHDKHLVEHTCYFVMDKLIHHIEKYNPPRYITDEAIDAMFPYLLVGSVREQTKWNEMQEMRRIGAKAMRDKILTYVSELEQLRQPTVISCVCPNEIKTGTVSIDCCNLCGKPDEDWWSKHCL